MSPAIENSQYLVFGNFAARTACGEGATITFFKIIFIPIVTRGGRQMRVAGGNA